MDFEGALGGLTRLWKVYGKFQFYKTIGIRFHSRLRGLIAQRSGFGKTQRGTTQLLLGVCHAAPSRHGQLGAQKLAAAHS